MLVPYSLLNGHF